MRLIGIVRRINRYLRSQPGAYAVAVPFGITVDKVRTVNSGLSLQYHSSLSHGWFTLKPGERIDLKGELGRVLAKYEPGSLSLDPVQAEPILQGKVSL
jgi:hypothetical protein